MTNYQVYYLANAEGIHAGPFPTVEAAVEGKKKFHPLYATLLKVVKGNIQAEPV
jgi:hypothetical protein